MYIAYMIMADTLRCDPYLVSQVRHDISWFDKDSSAVGILTSRLESEASMVSGSEVPSSSRYRSVMRT